jgi:fatty acid desaturase
MLKALRYGLMNLLMLAWITALLAGGLWAFAVYAAAAFLTTIGDEHLGEDTTMLGGGGRWFYNFNLYATLPLIAFGVFLTMGHVAPQSTAFIFDPVFALFGADYEAARAATDGWSLAGMIIAGGLMVGAAGVNVSHELMHRTGNLFAWLSSRWLLAFSLDTTFAIEHVHGHHRYVGTLRDPATARRGEYVLGFALRSTIGQIVNAFRFEAARLARRGKAALSVHNLALRGQLMSLALIVASYALGGWVGVVVFLLLAIQGKLYLELVNYVEHYGLIRAEGGKVEPRHAWNCYNIVSSAVLYNLPRHSHHHMFATKPFWSLEAEPEAPMLPYGYKSMIVISFFPSLWRRIVEPRLADWDRRFASPEERAILAERGQGMALSPAE